MKSSNFEYNFSFPLGFVETSSKFSFADEVQKKVFKQYIVLYNLIAAMPRLKNVLEIGAGYSTVLLALLGKERNFRPLSIDYAFDRLIKATDDTVYRGLVEQYVEKLEGVSITPSEFTTFYNRMREGDNFCGQKLSDVFANAKLNINSILDSRKLSKVATLLKSDATDDGVWASLVKDSKQLGSMELLNVYSESNDFKNEIKFLEGCATLKKDGHLKRVLKSTDEFDAVFLDSGELAGNPEFEMTINHIRIGGLVALHDVFFPKSFKNFLAAAVIRMNSNWEILYEDHSTAQGMLIAKRLR